MRKLTPNDVKILFEGPYASIDGYSEDGNDDIISGDQFTGQSKLSLPGGKLPESFSDIPIPEEFPDIVGDINLPPELINQVLVRKKTRVQPRDISQVRRVVDEEHISVTSGKGVGQRTRETPPIKPPKDQEPNDDEQDPSKDPSGDGQNQGETDPQTKEPKPGRGSGEGPPTQEPGEPGEPGDGGTEDGQESKEPDDSDKPGGGGGPPKEGKQEGEQGQGQGEAGEFDPNEQGQGSGQGEPNAGQPGSKPGAESGEDPGGEGSTKRPEKDTSPANSVAKDNMRDRMRDAQKDFWKKLSPEQRKQLIDQTKKATEDIEEDPEITRDWMKQKVKTATKIDSAGGRGEGHGKDLIDRVMDRMKPQIDWKQALKNFVTRRAKKYYNIRKPSKRGIGAKVYLPRAERDREVDKFVVSIDISGSVMDAYPYFISEIMSLFERVKGAEAVIVFWHDVVVGAIELNRHNYRTLLSMKQSGGGTTISSFGYWLASLNWNPAGVIILTDGHIEGNPFLPTKTKNGKTIVYKSFIVPNGNYESLKPWGDVYKIL